MQRRTADANIRIIENMLYKQKAIRAAVLDYRASKGGHTGGGVTGHAFVSDPTAGEALRNVEEVGAVILTTGEKICKPERWIKLFRFIVQRSALCFQVVRNRLGRESVADIVESIPNNSFQLVDLPHLIALYNV